MSGKQAEQIACCGVDCAVCADFRQDACPGCRESTWPENDLCPPIACCVRRGITLCGDCEAFPCAMMREFYEESDSHRAAYARMRRLREAESSQPADAFQKAPFKTQ